MNTYAPLDQEIKQLCQRYQARLLTLDEQTVTVAVTDDVAPALLTALKFASNRRVVVERWSQAKLEQAFHPVPQVAESDAVFGVTPTAEPTDEEMSVIHYINQTLAQAFQRRASDIHFEPMAGNYRVRMRIDGVLHICPPPPLDWAARLTARLKIMGQLDIAERRLPQDGQFSFALDTQSISLRIATLPVLEGEKGRTARITNLPTDAHSRQSGLSADGIRLPDTGVTAAPRHDPSDRAHGKRQNSHTLQRYMLAQ